MCREFPLPLGGLGEGLRRFFIFVFEGGVNLDFKHSNAIFNIDVR